MNLVIFTGSIFGLLAVILGAFGAHALKNIFSSEQLQSFETGVKYQMYHAIVLLVLGFTNQESSVLHLAYILFTVGTCLFSFSIYLLCYTGYKGKKWKFLGPVTPLGGLLLVLGWATFTYYAVTTM